ncbi:MAG: TolB family protein, partial [Actinomycetota bacterium]
MALDERLKRELERAARPADPSGVYEHLIRRRERRRIARKVQSAALAVVVVLGSIGGFYALTRVFREGAPPVAAPSVSNGLIVVSRDVPGEGVHLFAASPDGSEVRQFTPQGRAVYRSPDVSPDGRTIVVAHEIPSFERGLSVLALLPIDGGSPEWLTEPAVVRDPAWSPDGSRIAFAGSLGGPFGIYVFDFGTGDIELVPGTDDNSVGHPTWSPDGSRIAFEASTGSNIEIEQMQATWDIYSV